MDKLSVKRTISYCLVGMFMVACTTTGEEDVGAQPPKLERKADMDTAFAWRELSRMC